MSKELEEARQIIKRQQLEIENLKLQLSELVRRIYGSSSEKLDPDQLKLFDPDEAKKPDAAVPGDPGPVAKPARKRSNVQRLKKSIEDLPTTREVIEPEGINQSEWKRIGEEVTEELHYQPASYHRHLIIRPKYARRQESLEEANIATAPLPPRLLEGSVLTPSLLAGIVTAKYCWHQPVYRQKQMMKTAGIECSDSLMCHWLGRGGNLLLPLHQALKGQLLASDYLQGDETPIDFLDPGHGSTRKGYLWTLHNPQIGVLYEWHTGRGQKHLDELMGGQGEFQGILQHDAYQPYLTLAKDRQLQQVACMAHIRRGFDKALKDRPEVATWFLNQFARLYRIESELRATRAGPEERSRRRRCESRPIYELIKKAVLHLRQNRPILPNSPLGKALTYALGQLPHMETWIEHGQVEIDNNLIENSIRPTKLGAKNWLFFGSARSGTMGAVLYTLVENVRRLNRDPFAYLTWVFGELARNPRPEKPEDLLPQAWAKAHPDGRQLRAA